MGCGFFHLRGTGGEHNKVKGTVWNRLFDGPRYGSLSVQACQDKTVLLDGAEYVLVGGNHRDVCGLKRMEFGCNHTANAATSNDENPGEVWVVRCFGHCCRPNAV